MLACPYFTTKIKFSPMNQNKCEGPMSATGKKSSLKSISLELW